MMMGDMGPFLAGSAIFALLLVVAANVLRRVSARHPDGRHWLLRTLALLCPASLLAAVVLGNVGPHLLGGPGPASSTPTLWATSMVLVLIGAFSAPVCWRVVLQHRLGRASSSLSFFHATRTQLCALFVLAAVYVVAVKRIDAADMPAWLLQPGVLQIALSEMMQLVHLAMVAVMLTLPLMALRALARLTLRRAQTLLGRVPQG
ncbi:hypothetical protein IAE57_18355 [Stenotrophomonas sp. S48]|uniref:hypothetical protein n=1 Tax=unclassified Stenotrophomonas TaxID=196198 RepID=UPI001900A0EF|nr:MULTISPECIES: hypothetical protein [unclassified Stenotrophomonas]MBK0028127.1 hypothetical protein [Stenotrophomonas sp. S48]MBK0049528.1 hypothetical protein [Stenotrophomonas sp. S49]